MGEAKEYYGECLYGHWESPMKKVIKDNYPKLHKIIIVVQLVQSVTLFVLLRLWNEKLASD